MGFAALNPSYVTAVSPPFQSFIAVHTALPLTQRELVVCNSEAIVVN